MIIDHHARFAWKRFSRSEDILWTFNYWHVYLCCDLDFAQSVQIVSQYSLAPDDVPSNYVCRQKDQQSRRYSSNRSILMMSALTVIMTLNINQPAFFTWHSGSWSCTTIPSLITKGWAVQKISSGQTEKRVISKYPTPSNFFEMGVGGNNPMSFKVLQVSLG